MKRIIAIVFFSGMLFLLGCEKNTRPEILEIICNPETGVENTTFALTALCQDLDGDQLTYIWTSQSGEFLFPDNDFKVKWKSPAVLLDTSITISLHVSDGFEIVTRNKSINILNSFESELSVTTLSVSEITNTSAVCGGSIIYEGEKEIISRGVCWDVNPNPSVQNNRTLDGNGSGEFISRIEGLIQGSTYYVRAYAEYDQNTVYGDEKSFTTLNGTDGSFTDIRDNNTYRWIQIGNQVWMQENLAWLPNVSRPTSGSKSTSMFYVQGHYGTSVTKAKENMNYGEYGVLYNWPASLLACPEGWHLPSVSEWEALFNYLGGEAVAGGKMKEEGLDHWYEPNYLATNSSGFTALAGGDRSIWPDFYYLKETAFFWASDEFDASAGNSYSLHYEDEIVRPYPWNKAYGFSVRCVKDE